MLLQGSCCWPDNDGLLYKISGWSIFLNLFLMDICLGLYFCQHIGDLSDALQRGGEVIGLAESTMRLYIMLTKRNIINSILVKIWKQFWPINVLAPTDRKRLKRKARVSIMLTLIFLISSLACGTRITYDPYLRDHSLLLKSVFPFDWHRPFVYAAVYIWQYFLVWMALFIMNAYDFFFVALVTICSVQFMILQDVIRNILTKISKFQRTEIYGEEGGSMSDRGMLLKCLEQHKLLNRICNELEESFSIPILIQFFTSTTAICTACVILKIEPSQFFKVLLYTTAHLAQLFYYCFVGDDLSHQSEQLSTAIYECNWHVNYDRDFRKSLVLMIQRSQHVQRLSAIGMINLDYSSFVEVYS
ncbi:hypothetical protein Trydic_g14376 [Trypoxylus dichotomus]